jgi:hypothetical protein
MLKHMHILIYLKHVLSWYTSLEALELGFIFYLEFRYAVLSRGMNHWLDVKPRETSFGNQSDQFRH